MGTNTFLNALHVKLNAGEILCLAGAQEYDLYYILSGKLMVCVTKKTQVIPVAYLERGNYIGEISFFDHQPRSATVIATEESEVLKIPSLELKAQVPHWLISVAFDMINKLRHVDNVLQDKGIRKQNVDSIKPLPIEEQRHYYKLIENYISSNTESNQEH